MVSFAKFCSVNCCLFGCGIAALAAVMVLFMQMCSFALIMGWEVIGGAMVFAFVVGPFAAAFFLLPLVPCLVLVIKCRHSLPGSGRTFIAAGSFFLVVMCIAYLILCIWPPATNVRYVRLEWYDWVDPAQVDDVKGSDEFEVVFMWEEGKILPGVYGERRYFYCGEDSCTEGTFCAFPIVPDYVSLDGNGTNSIADYRIHSVLLCHIPEEASCLGRVNRRSSRCSRIIRRLWDGDVTLDQLVSIKSKVMRDNSYLDDWERAARDVRDVYLDGIIYNPGIQEWVENNYPTGPLLDTRRTPYILDIFTKAQFEEERDKAEGSWYGGLLTLYILVALCIVVYWIVLLVLWYPYYRRFSLPSIELPSFSDEDPYPMKDFTPTKTAKDVKVEEMWSVWQNGAKNKRRSYLSQLPAEVVSRLESYVRHN